MNNGLNAILAIISGVIGLAIISVLISPRAQTSAVLNATGGALSNVIGAAVAPVTGAGGSSAGGDSGLSFLNGLSFAPGLLSSA